MNGFISIRMMSVKIYKISGSFSKGTDNKFLFWRKVNFAIVSYCTITFLGKIS